MKKKDLIYYLLLSSALAVLKVCIFVSLLLVEVWAGFN